VTRARLLGKLSEIQNRCRVVAVGDEAEPDRGGPVHLNEAPNVFEDPLEESRQDAAGPRVAFAVGRVDRNLHPSRMLLQRFGDIAAQCHAVGQRADLDPAGGQATYGLGDVRVAERLTAAGEGDGRSSSSAIS
jgi:hypothetical protein